MPLLHLTTFNCAKISPQTEFLTKFVDSLPSIQPDIFIFGFQEISSILDCCSYETIQTIIKNYGIIIRDAINDKYNENIEIIGVESIGGIGIIVLSNESSHYLTDYVSCGIFNSSLKGGISIRIKYKDEWYSFITCHLTANEGNVLKRNEDFNKIIRNLYNGELFLPNGHVFIMGDLNYRVDFNTSTTYENDEFQLINDELTKNKKIGILNKFSESEIKFKPTYKFIVNSSEYKNNRTPSWCDRILYQSNYGKNELEVLNYDSIDTIHSSDHQPVYLTLKINDLPKHEENTNIKDVLFSKFENSWIKYSGKIMDAIIWFGLFSAYDKIGRIILAFILIFILYLLY